ncbi:MAG: hypothetical protein Fur0041_09210 [Bacteroidia bacterium]
MLSLTCLILSAQDVNLGKGYKKDKKSQDMFIIAEDHFFNNNQLLALPYYRKLEEKYPDAPIIIFRIGTCLLYKSDEVDEALVYLLKIKQMNPKAEDIDLYLARAYHLNERYDEALASIDLYEKKKGITPAKKKEADQLRKYCNNAKELSAKPVDAKIINLGSDVNTENSEYVPVLTSDDSILIFTYRGKKSLGGLQSFPGVQDTAGFYFEDVYFSKRTKDGWSEPLAMSNTINSFGHDANIAISNDGQLLLIYKDDIGGGDILISKYINGEWTAPEAIAGDVNTSSWEGSATFSNDLKYIYFSSERPGGYGGRDLYMASLQSDGTYGNVKNLGPVINTELDEDAPFAHPNGVSLIFSSQGHNSMGGYDIFKTEIDPATTICTAPENIGYPINTPGDDKYLVLGTDGLHGYYSSGKAGGYGQQDLYLVQHDFGIKTFVLMVNGTVFLDDKPVAATITVIDEAGKKETFQARTNSENGYYLVNLPQGSKYKLIYEIVGMEKQEKSADASEMKKSEKLTIDMKFYTNPAVVAKTKDSVIVTPPVTPSDTSKPIVKTPVISADYNDILATYGNASAPGLIFRVQIAAYNFPNNYNSSHLQPLGPIDKIVLDDNITRFTMGKFPTLAEAEAFRKQIIAAGQTDAFVTAEKDGKRYLLKELAELKFFQK